MGWSGGTYNRVHNWAADDAAAIDIESTRMDQEDDSIETGIDTCLTKDGQNTPTTNLPMATNRHTGVGNAQAKTDYASAADVIDQDLIFYVDTGAADVYVITPSPSIGAYEEGQRLIFRATNANTGASTMNANALGAIAIQTPDGNVLLANMILVGGYYELTYDVNASPDRWVMTSPHSLDVNSLRNMIAGTGMTGGGTLAADRTFNVIGGTGITANANDIATDDFAIVHDNLSGFIANEHINHAAVSVLAGTGLLGGGTIAGTRTLNVIGGTGITANADDIALSASVAGTGMTHTAGVLNVIGGDGIDANANDIALSSSVGGDGLTNASGVLSLTDAAASTTNPVDISTGAVSLDIEALTTIEGSALAATDTFYVEYGGVSKGVEVQAMGLQVQTAQGTQTLAAPDMNTIMEFTATSTLTLPINSGVDLPVGVPIILNVKHATQVLTVTAATSVTLVSINHPAGGSAASDTVNAGGSAVLFKTAADVWALSGDITD